MILGCSIVKLEIQVPVKSVGNTLVKLKKSKLFIEGEQEDENPTELQEAV